jgi:hypothetical protein
MSHIANAKFYTPFHWMSHYPNSYSSDYHDGNSERIGRTVVSYATDKVAAAMRVLKEDTACEAYLEQWLKKQK